MHNLSFVVMERMEGDTREFPILTCRLLETAEEHIALMRKEYPENIYSLYQCPNKD